MPETEGSLSDSLSLSDQRRDLGLMESFT